MDLLKDVYGVEFLLFNEKYESSRVSESSSEAGYVTGDVSREMQNLLNKVSVCTECQLHKTRSNVVFGEGNTDARLMFIGEGPGAEEDRQGRPFVGRAGQLLTKMINAMGLEREDVFITNIVKCRPPQNRNPFKDEISTCIGYLHKQIEIIKPEVIISLGGVAAQTLLNTEKGISRLRGKFTELNGIKLMPTFHPAYLLRNPKMKRPAWEDLQEVMKILGLKK